MLNEWEESARDTRSRGEAFKTQRREPLDNRILATTSLERPEGQDSVSSPSRTDEQNKIGSRGTQTVSQTAAKGSQTSTGKNMGECEAKDRRVEQNNLLTVALRSQT